MALNRRSRWTDAWTLLVLGGLGLAFPGCGGGGDSSPAAVASTPPSTTPSPRPKKKGFVFNPMAPHAAHLSFDARDQALPRTKGRDGAGVFVYATRNGGTYVLLGRRASWLGAAGEWNIFGGSVERTDLDSTGSMSFARAAEHELYEESVTVYHSLDANALRACPSHLKQWRVGSRYRTFFAKLPYVPREQFLEGCAYARQHSLAHAYQENDDFRWVRLEDLKAAGLARTKTALLTDVDGREATYTLFSCPYNILTEPDCQELLERLP